MTLTDDWFVEEFFKAQQARCAVGQHEFELVWPKVDAAGHTVGFDEECVGCGIAGEYRPLEEF